ncbi:MAG: hypothetical protein V4553_01080 [Bacteroidota bacterium]
METTAYNDPIDDQITNDDNSVTNKDGDNELEKAEPPLSEDDIDVDKIATADDNMGDPTPLKEEDEDHSNKGQGPKGENL